MSLPIRNAVLLIAFTIPCFVGACKHTPPGELPPNQLEAGSSEVNRPPAVTSLELLALAEELSDPVEFRSEVLRRFKALGGRRSYEGIRDFVTECRVRGRASWGHGILSGVRPVMLLQTISAGRYIQPTKELAKTLGLEAGVELDRAYALAERGQWEQLARLAGVKYSVLDAALVAWVPELEPHQSFLAVLADYAALDDPGVASDEALEALALRLEPVRAQLMALEAPTAQFLANVAHAQLMERRGRMDEAAEVWLQVVDTQAWLDSPEPMRNAIAARITSYTQRLRDSLAAQLEEERRAEILELHRRYTGELDRLEQAHSNFESWVRSNDNEVEVRLDELKREDEALWRELKRVETIPASSSESALHTIGVAADVLTIMTPVRAGVRGLRSLVTLG